MRVLVIFELIPEKLVIKVADMTTEEYEYFSKVDGYIVNGSSYNEELVEINQVLSNAICDDSNLEQYAETEKEKAYFGKWPENLDNTNCHLIEKVIKTGMII